MNHYQLAEFHIAIDIPSVEDDNYSALFPCEDPTTEPDMIFRAVPLEADFFRNRTPLEKTGGYELFKVDDDFFLLNHWCTDRFGYGFYISDLQKGDIIPVYCNENLNPQYPLQATRLLSTIGLHAKLLQFGFPILHASYICYNEQAILFTAPAQTGKSTQASLWQKHLGAQIINGDRVLLGKSRGTWNAYGCPCCGSSYFCVNRTLPIRAIVVLEQAGENEIQLLTAAQKVRALVSGFELYPWNKCEIDMAFSVASEFITQVPVFKLRCRPDTDAVMCLKNYLEEDLFENLI